MEFRYCGKVGTLVERVVPNEKFQLFSKTCHLKPLKVTLKIAGNGSWASKRGLDIGVTFLG